MATLVERAESARYDESGNRMKHLDMMSYQAASSISNIWRRSKEMNAAVAQLNNIQNQKLMAYREFEEDTNIKLGIFSKINKTVNIKQSFAEILTTTLKNEVITRRSKSSRIKIVEPNSPVSMYFPTRSSINSPRTRKTRESAINNELFHSKHILTKSFLKG